MARPIATLFLAALTLLGASAAWAEDFPQSPKIKPPEPLPEATCNTAQPNSGDWLAGSWVAPLTQFEFSRATQGFVFTMDRKAGPGEFGMQEGGVITGRVAAVSACTMRLEAGDNGEFAFDGVLTEDGKIYGYALNKAGDSVRFTLRRRR